MPKGVDQVAEAAAICRTITAELNGLPAADTEHQAFAAHSAALADRLEALKTKFFLRMGPAVRYTAACLAAAQAVHSAFAAGGPAEAVAAKLDALESATTTLEDRANAAGSMTIT